MLSCLRHLLASRPFSQHAGIGQVVASWQLGEQVVNFPLVLEKSLPAAQSYAQLADDLLADNLALKVGCLSCQLSSAKGAANTACTAEPRADSAGGPEQAACPRAGPAPGHQEPGESSAPAPAARASGELPKRCVLSSCASWLGRLGNDHDLPRSYAEVRCACSTLHS